MKLKKKSQQKKTSWGNLTSFLAKHIQSIVETDENMIQKKGIFKDEIKESTEEVLKDSELDSFIDSIRTNYSRNLRDNNCYIEFGLPEYEDIFLEMMFKVGLNGDNSNLVPIEQFGDGYISMFVMAVIQAIAETNNDDKCLFLFEEPESFLHENHQEYFYSTVLCGLAERGHQVIYTTHSDKMLDIFNTEGLVRLEYDEQNKQTEVKYNKPRDHFDPTVEVTKVHEGELLNEHKDYNNYIKIIEPNLNKIIFSKKVLLVEGPNDMLVYKELIRRKVYEKTDNEKYAETFLNFNNIAVIPHHGKITALVLIKLCKHLGVDYYVINDFDFSNDFVNELNFDSEEEYKNSHFYRNQIKDIEEYNSKGERLSERTMKAMVTTNWRIVTESQESRIHFNVPKLENVIGYERNDKDSIGIWESLGNMEDISDTVFPQSLNQFLEIDNLSN
ncbi:ATP-dependent nuclease [Halobacillus mangrovi]|uniref:ATP-dependent nuclease n=1 Tax=Halobacillus mangrovi TaxID=402384 RepID=UPI003D95668C